MVLGVVKRNVRLDFDKKWLPIVLDEGTMQIFENLFFKVFSSYRSVTYQNQDGKQKCEKRFNLHDWTWLLKMSLKVFELKNSFWIIKMDCGFISDLFSYIQFRSAIHPKGEFPLSHTSAYAEMSWFLKTILLIANSEDCLPQWLLSFHIKMRNSPSMFMDLPLSLINYQVKLYQE